jgi:hypothetical protein
VAKLKFGHHFSTYWIDCLRRERETTRHRATEVGLPCVCPRSSSVHRPGI